MDRDTPTALSDLDGAYIQEEDNLNYIFFNAMLNLQLNTLFSFKEVNSLQRMKITCRVLVWEAADWNFPFVDLHQYLVVLGVQVNIAGENLVI